MNLAYFDFKPVHDETKAARAVAVGWVADWRPNLAVSEHSALIASLEDRFPQTRISGQVSTHVLISSVSTQS